MTNVNAAEEALGLAIYHQSLAAQNTAKAQQYLEQYRNLLPGGKGIGAYGANTNGPKCLRVWADYLAEHGPSLRQEIQDATGTKFTERATPYTIMWDDGMAAYGDDHFDGNTIVRMRSVRTGEGKSGTATAYFLWSQRFDVFDRFGVGPRMVQSQALLGVIHPPATVESHSNAIPDPEPKVETPEYERFATLEEWHERWDPVFDEVAPYDAQPTDEEKVAMKATLPEDTGGESPSVILAFAYSDAKVRSRS